MPCYKEIKLTQSPEDGELLVEILNSGAGYKNNSVDNELNFTNLQVEDEIRYKLILNKKTTAFAVVFLFSQKKSGACSTAF